MMSGELQAIAKILDVRHIDAPFDILFVNTNCPSPLINVVVYLVITIKATSNSIEIRRGKKCI